LRFLVPAPLGNDVSFRVTVAHPDDRVVLAERRTEMPSEIDLDVSSFPRVEHATVQANGARPSIAWTTKETSVRPDVVVAKVTWPETKQSEWTVLLRPEAPPRFVLPALPEDLGTFRPAGVRFAAAVALLEASFYEGYRDVRNKGLGLLEDPPEAPVTSIRYAVAGDLDF
jgi:hypothetical protein